MHHRQNSQFYTLLRIAILVVISLFVFLTGCTGKSADVSSLQGTTTISLNMVTPLIGDEEEVRSPAPEPIRLMIPDESVLGWPAPPEGMLRFPVRLGENPRISVRLGITGEFQELSSDLEFSVEYRQSSNRNGRQLASLRTQELWSLPLQGHNELKDFWTPLDFSAAEFSGTGGEIVLAVRGSLRNQPGIVIHWGSPSVYYPDQRRHKNILLIGIDTLRADAISPYDESTGHTPSIESLAQRSVVFDRAWSQAPWTLPSFASIITGEYPSWLDATGFSEHIPISATTVGERLGPLGYATFTACSNGWLGNEDSGFEQGMDGLWYRHNAEAPVIAARALDFLNRSRDRDWFCFLHFIDPHCPYDPPDDLAEMYHVPGYTGEFTDAFCDCAGWPPAEIERPPDSDIAQMRRLYDGEVAGLDRVLGGIFDYLDENGLIEDTLIIFCSDHGEEFYEHGGFEHGHTQYEELTRMPLIVSGPGFDTGTRFGHPVCNLDIVPTILDYAGLSVPDDLPGLSLIDYVSETVNGDDYRMIFGEETGGSIRLKFAVDWPWKCLVDYLTGETALFDLENDPGEHFDISAENPDIVTRMSEAIAENLHTLRSVIVLSFVGNVDEGTFTFKGSIEVPGGINQVKAYTMFESDTWSQDAESISFEITADGTVAGSTKSLVIFPSADAETVNLSIEPDILTWTDRLYPYGTTDPESINEASVNIYDFPTPANYPENPEMLPSSVYLLCIPGDPDAYRESDLTTAELSDQVTEELRALGYIH